MKFPGIPVSTDPKGDLEEASRQLGEGNTSGAFGCLQKVLTYPGPSDLSEELFREALQLLAQIAAQFSADLFENSALHAITTGDGRDLDATALYNVGFELVGQAQSGMAATVLSRARLLKPDDEAILTELVVALERDQNYETALHYLNETPSIVENSFVNLYQKAWISIQIGDLETAREAGPRLKREANDMGHERYDFMAKRVDKVIRRAEAVDGLSKLDKEDLRGWHYALGGGILLHVSPYGQEVMHGRYCWIQDTNALIHEGIQKIQLILRQQEVNPPRIFALPAHKSTILAHALSQALDCPLVHWPEGGSHEPGIIVAYDLEEIDEEVHYAISAQRYPGQVLWAHSVCWTSPEPCIPAPEFVTYLRQHYVSPWEVGLRSQADEADEPDTRKDLDLAALNIEELASKIRAAELGHDALDDVPTILALAGAARFGRDPDDAAGPPARGLFWPGSPVPSNRFG